MQTPRRIGGIELPPIDQVGYVVRDLEATLARYAPIFGPFTRMESKLTGVRFRGRPCDVHLDMAFGHTGNVEIEFIAVKGGESPHSEFLAAGREGIHHIRYRVPDCDTTLSALRAEGFEPIWYHDMGFAKWAYLEHASRDGVLIELLEMESKEADNSRPTRASAEGERRRAPAKTGVAERRPGKGGSSQLTGSGSSEGPHRSAGSWRAARAGRTP